MSDEMSRLISKFSAGSKKAEDASDESGGSIKPGKDDASRRASGGSTPRTGRTSGMSAFVKPAGTPTAAAGGMQTTKEPADKTPLPAKTARKKSAPEEEEWTLPTGAVTRDMISDDHDPLPDPDPEPLSGTEEPPVPPVKKEKKHPLPIFGGGKTKKAEPEPEYATVETAGARPAMELPLRNGRVGRVSNLREIPEKDIPSKVERWFTSLFTGAPYTPTNEGAIFLLLPEDDDPEGVILEVTAYGSLGLTNNMRLCVQGRSEKAQSIIAHRIERDASVDASRPVWAPVRDHRERSALALWLTIIVIIVAAVLTIQGIVLPLLSGLAVILPDLIVWGVFILILIMMFRGPRRGGRRWF